MYFTYPTPKLRATIARYTFPNNSRMPSPIRALLEGIWQDPEGMVHQAHGPKGELNLRFRLKWDGHCHKNTAVARVVRFGVHGGGSSRCSTIAHRKTRRVLQDSLQADLMGFSEVVQYDAWDPANQTVPSLGLSDDVSWIRLKWTVAVKTASHRDSKRRHRRIDRLHICDGKVIATHNRGVLQDGANDGAFGMHPLFPFHWLSAKSCTRCSV